MVLDLHRTAMGGQEGTNSQHPLVSVSFYPSTACSLTLRLSPASPLENSHPHPQGFALDVMT